MSTPLLRAVATLPMLPLLIGAARVTPLASIPDARDPNVCLSLQEVAYAPGQGSKPHTHQATIIAYVLSGEVESQVGDEKARIYRRGDHWVEPEGSRHVISRNASSASPAVFLAILVAHRGTKEAAACGF